MPRAMSLPVKPMNIRFLPPLLAIAACAEDTIDKPLPPEEAAASMIVPEGFSVTLFAGEPDVVQPIDFCIDDRGRLWVCEALSYPKHTDQPAGDRITIFEDTDNDGKHDKRTVFYDKLNYVTGIEVGFGGAWVMSPPHFYFIPDKDGDDIPDGEPEVVLDGFGNHANSHNLANGFEWGPDGWLYGTHGRTNWSMIGKPGTPESERTRFDGGVWRFDPVTREWESFCDGTTNPWGIDWDETGEAFMTNCVNPHLFHAIQGAHYEPWRGRQSSQHAYQRIETIADHLHYAGENHAKFDSDETRHLGGGHAHCGVLVYPKTGPWPEPFRGTVFMNNIHGDRINVDLLSRKGSGYTASHGPDLMKSKDPWFMGVALQLAPDGSVYVSDWSDTGECHSTRNTQKATGRIFKISYGKPEMPQLELNDRSTPILTKLAVSDNRFIERHARRILWERSEGFGNQTESDRRTYPVELLKTKFESANSEAEKLRALWALRCVGRVDDEFLFTLLSSEFDSIRAWSIRLLCETNDRGPLNEGHLNNAIRNQLLWIAGHEESDRVILSLISGAMRMPIDDRWEIFEEFAWRELNPEDQNLLLMLWYGIEGMFQEAPESFSNFAISPNPLIRQFVSRRVASELGLRTELNKLLRLHIRSGYGEQKAVFEGILEGLEGVRNVEAPEDWEMIKDFASRDPDPDVMKKAIQLALIFDDPKALKSLKSNVKNSEIPDESRIDDLNLLLQNRPDDLDQLLLELIEDPAVQATAIRGLANFKNPDTPVKILEIYPILKSKQDALQTLASRANWASQLLDAVESGDIPRTDLTAFTARQIVNLKDETLTKRIAKLWGELKSSSAEKKKQMAAFRKKLTPESIKKSDPKAGRGHFQKLCASCHQLFGEGGEVGPELTGSQRNNLDYLLENLIDPSASVSKDFQMQIIETVDGRLVSGFAESENETAVTIRSINEKIVIPQNEIKTRTVSGVSIMPEGLLTVLSTDEIRELMAYLASPTQVK